MSIFDYFKRKPTKATAAIAKERLHIVMAHEHRVANGPDYLPALKRELMEVIAKYVHIQREDIKVNLERHGDCEILELNIALPEDKESEMASPTRKLRV